MERKTLQAEVREERGKGPARQLRMQGRLPAVLYGRDLSPQALSVAPKDLVRALSTQWGRNVVIELAAGGDTHACMIRELQTHPVTGVPLHVDFHRVDMDRPVKVRVPFATRGRAVGVQRGGKLKVVFRDVPVSAAPDAIPASIVADVSKLDQGETIDVADLQLPEGVTVTLKPERTLVLVEGERKKPTEEAEEAEAAEAPAEA